MHPAQQEFIRPVVNTDRRLATASVKIAAACLLLALAAQLRIPVPGTPVPMTLQSFAVVLVGLSLAPASAAAAAVLYLALGAAGLPVFAPGSAGLLGPTGGYLVGFVGAAWVTSALCGRNAGVIRMAVASLAGLSSLFVFGVSWLSVYAGNDLMAALVVGFVPFLLKAIVELGLAVAIVANARHIVRRSPANAAGQVS